MMGFHHHGSYYPTALFFNSEKDCNDFLEKNKGSYGLLAITETEPIKYVVAHMKDTGKPSH